MSVKEACEKAIVAHASWKANFRKFMAGEITLDPATVEQEGVCDFGQWLLSAGRGDLPPPRFAEIRSAHAEFHRCAATVVRARQTGDVAGAESALAPSGVFARASALLTSLIVKVRDGA